MCAVSFVGDAYRDYYRDHMPKYMAWPAPGISKEDFDALKAKVDEMLAMLAAARKFDIATGQKDCQMDEKIALLRQIAALVGLDLDKVVFEEAAEASAEGE